MTTALVTASTSSLPMELIQRYGIELIPFTIQFVDGNLRESEDVSLDEFYRRLVDEDVIPTTAPSSAGQFINYFRQHPADDIIVIHVGSMLSQSYANAMQAASRVQGRMIYNIDSRQFALGTGLLVLEAAEALARGASAASIVSQIEHQIPNILTVASLETVRYLRLSGRLGRIGAMAASLLGIYPILGLDRKGQAEMVGRARSREDSLNMMIQQALEFVGKGKVRRMGILHTNALPEAQTFAQQVSTHFPGVPLLISDAGPVLAVHGGPGALGISVLREEA